MPRLKEKERKFPSPHGDFVFERGSILSERRAPPASFRPLTGILFSNDWLCGYKERRIQCFRPLTGILFSNAHDGDNTGHAGRRSFRPLTGILFSNGRQERKDYHENREMFPSPHGDFVFELGYDEKHKARLETKVSVPSRGFCFRTFQAGLMMKPIRHLFPSPHGDFVFELRISGRASTVIRE